MNVHDTLLGFDSIRRTNRIQPSRHAKRFRRVRISYPAALVELALVLSATVGKRKAASAIGVGISTIYRWADSHRTAWMPSETFRTDGPASINAEVISTLSTRCQRAGFRVNTGLQKEKAEVSSHEGDPANSIKQFRPVSVTSEDRVSAACVSTTEPMSRAKQEIEANYAKPLTCRYLAAVSGMPRIQFIRKFSSTFGTPPYHYLLGVRVKRATELLQYSSESLAVVASTTGFGSTSSMQRAFKRFAGGSPGAVVSAIAPMREVAIGNISDSFISS